MLGLRDVWTTYAEERMKASAHWAEAPVTIRGEQVERVTAFPYLGSILGEDSVGKELSARLRKAGDVFAVLKPHVWKRRDLTLRLKLRLFNSAVMSSLCYGIETWPIHDRHLRRLEAFHCMCLRTITRMPRLERTTNQAVLQKAGTCPLRDTARLRRLRWFGHVRRMPLERWPRKMLGAVIGGRKRSGGQRVTWENLVQRDCKTLGIADSWNLSLDRAAWKKACRPQAHS